MVVPPLSHGVRLDRMLPTVSATTQSVLLIPPGERLSVITKADLNGYVGAEWRGHEVRVLKLELVEAASGWGIHL